MAVLLSPVGGVAAQFFTNAGVPLSGGKIYTYAAGTSTPQATYTTGAGNVQHSNPIVLDAAGRVPTGEIWLTDGLSYKFVLKDNNDVLIATYDNIVGINSNFVNFVNQQEIQTATAGQTVFNLTTMEYQPGIGNLSVFVDGVNQYGPGAQYAYTETDSNTVTFVSGLHVGASVKFTTTEIQNSGVADASQITYTYPATGAVTESVESRLAQYQSVADYGVTSGDALPVANTIVSNTAVGDLAIFTCNPGTTIAPQDITGIKNCGKSITITHYDSEGLANNFQHNQGPYGTSGVPDNEYTFAATDNPAVVIESITRTTSGTPINQDRSDGNRRADNASLVYRLNCFSDLPKNTFQLNSIWQHEDLTPGAEQPELDGTFFVSWFYDTNTNTYHTKNPIYIENFAYGNSQVEANRKESNFLGYVGINTYDCKGYQHHIYSSKSGSNASLLSSSTGTVKQTFLDVTWSSSPFFYDQIQNGAYNFGFTYISGGTYGRSFGYIRPSAVNANLGQDITNGTMFAYTTPNGNTLKSRTIQQQVELGTDPLSNNPLWTSGTGSPEGVVTAVVGSMYSRTDGGANTTLYVKESGTGNTGWVAK